MAERWLVAQQDLMSGSKMKHMAWHVNQRPWQMRSHRGYQLVIEDNEQWPAKMRHHLWIPAGDWGRSWTKCPLPLIISCSPKDPENLAATLGRSGRVRNWFWPCLSWNVWKISWLTLSWIRETKFSALKPKKGMKQKLSFISCISESAAYEIHAYYTVFPQMLYGYQLLLSNS